MTRREQAPGRHLSHDGRAAARSFAAPTFNKDVLPILQKSGQSCHRPVDVIAKWADRGAAEGNAKDAPAPLKWADDWFIKPRVIVDGPSFDVPAKAKNNVIEWVSITVPSGFKEDTWVTSVQIKPKYTAVAHHICLGFNPHSPNIKYFEPVWIDKNRDEEGSAIPGGRETDPGRKRHHTHCTIRPTERRQPITCRLGSR